MAYQEHQQASRSIVARCAIVTLSDTRTPQTDRSGQLIRRLLGEARHSIADYTLLRDEPAELRAHLDKLFALPDINVILTTGGTGISDRDATIAVITRLLDVPLPGFGELFRMLSWHQIGSGAMMSRAAGGVARGKLLFAMPGSQAAVELAMTGLILPELGHLLFELAGK